ncbi:MAG TPA: NADH-quinone oxidoreductase subunit J [Planctomycetota bacterium]|nr:NADH-quinone oxidoreductase subunit J [Planctomycetota bacterium]
MKHDVSPWFFYLFAATSVLPGVFVLASKDIVRAAFWLLMALSGFAGLYVLLGADFLAITQVVVYLGGILILILFGVMLTHRDPALVKRARRLNIVVPGIAGGAVLAAAVAAAMTRAHFAVPSLTVMSVTPPAGLIEPGTQVTITGSNLGVVSTVTLAGKSLQNLQVSYGEITGTATARADRSTTIALLSTVVGTLTLPPGGETPGPGKPIASKALPLPEGQFKGTTQDIGVLLVAESDEGRSYLLPFEIASVLLLAALVGAAYLARRGGPHEQYENVAEGQLHG